MVVAFDDAEKNAKLSLRQSEILEKLRVVLGLRTVVFSKVVRNADAVKTTTRAWREVNEYTRERNLLVRLYCRSRQALAQLGGDSSLLNTHYQPLTKNDLKVTKDLTEVNRYDAKNGDLPWFWRMNKDKDLQEGSIAMMECKLLVAYAVFSSILIIFSKSIESHG